MPIIQVADNQRLMASIIGPTGPAGGPTGPSGGGGGTGPTGATGPAGGGGGSGNSPFITVGFAAADYIVDGTADQVEINAAIAAVSAAGGGIVHLKASVNIYNLAAAIRIKDNVTLQGEGHGTHLFLINGANDRGLTNFDHTLGNVNFHVRNLYVDGNGVNQTANTKDLFYFLFSSDFSVRDNHLKNGNRHNCFMSDGCQRYLIHGNRLQDPLGLSNLSGFNGNDIVVSNNINTGATQTGMKFDLCHTLTITGNDCTNNATIGIYVTQGSSVAITGNTTRGQQNGVRVTSNDFVTISGNSIRDASQHGIDLLQACKGINISGNIVRDVGSDAANTYSGIHMYDVGDGCRQITVEANTIYDAVGNMKHGIHSENLTDYVTYGSNTIYGAVTAAVSLVGLNNVNTDHRASPGLVGPPGNDGEDGDRGPPGPAGPTGPTGGFRAASGTDDVAIANTETVVCQLTFAANELAAGQIYAFETYATRVGAISASEVIRVRCGLTALTGNIAGTLTPPVNTLAVGNRISGQIKIRSGGAGGTLAAMIMREIHLAAVTITPAVSAFTAAVAVDTTTANIIIALTFISGNAGNTYTFRNSAIWRVL